MTKISFALIRRSILCIRGLRLLKCRTFVDASMGAVVEEGRMLADQSTCAISCLFSKAARLLFYKFQLMFAYYFHFIDRFGQYETFYEDVVLGGPRTIQYSPGVGEGHFLIYFFTLKLMFFQRTPRLNSFV